jgi:SAM-dependent methyltransferase
MPFDRDDVSSSYRRQVPDLGGSANSYPRSVNRPVGAPKPFSHYDRRNFETYPIAEGYARWAPTYDAMMDERLDLDLLDASPRLRTRVAGARVVDLGCGTGRVGTWLRANGAREVIGVDLSKEMLERAPRELYTQTVVAPITATGLAAGTFDGAISSMVLDHVADLAGFFAEAHRLLRPGGWLAVVDFHPFFMMRGVPTHFASGDTQVAIENHIHALRDFFQLAAGFVVEEFEERFVTDEWADAVPGYRKHVGLPVTHAWLYRSLPSGDGVVE